MIINIVRKYCDLDCDPEDVHIYTGHPLFNVTECITLLFIVQSLLHCNPPNISGLKLSRLQSRSNV